MECPGAGKHESKGLYSVYFWFANGLYKEDCPESNRKVKTHVMTQTKA